MTGDLCLQPMTNGFPHPNKGSWRPVRRSLRGWGCATVSVKGLPLPGDQLRFVVEFDLCATRMSTTPEWVRLFRLLTGLIRGAPHALRLLKLTGWFRAGKFLPSGLIPNGNSVISAP